MRRLFLLPLIFGLVSLLALAPKQTPPTSLLIQNGMLIDGTGAAPHRADVRVVGDTITELGHLTPLTGDRVLDAKGLIVAPGFIDAHSHADGGILSEPDAETQIRQGITTAIVGQDGGSNYPLSDWFASIEKKGVALNFASFVGHGTVRSKVIGEEASRAATAGELKEMAESVDREMQAGALGLSSGLEYVPGRYGDTQELVSCAKAAAKHGGLYISHVRNEDNQAFAAFDELITIAKQAGLPAQISHIKLGSARVWGKAGEVLKRIRQAKQEGLDISADVYPYTYWQSTIRVIIATEEFEDRKQWEQGFRDVGGAEHVRLTSYTLEPSWQGKTLAEIAVMTGKDPVSLAQEIVRRTSSEKGSESVVVTAMSEKDVRTFVAAPETMFCSDGGLHGTHPRGAGSFPRILGEYVRRQKALPLAQAIRKMTSLPARRMGLSDRGTVAVGKKADLVLFNAVTVSDTSTVAHPTSAPVGLLTVIENGVPVLDNGKVTGAHPGRALRRM